MPELPEVETVCRGLAVLLANRTIRAIEISWGKSFAVDPDDLQIQVIGAQIVRVWRRGKMLFLGLHNGFSLAIHLRMTGQLVFVADGGSRFGAGHPSDSLIDRLPDRSTRVVFELTGGRLFFNDQRKFGRIQLVRPGGVEELAFISRLGPEPLEDAFTPEVLHQAVSRFPGKKIKAVLLDQAVIAGIGNIYADEALWGARVHPDRNAGSLTKQETALLWQELRSVMNTSIEQGGSTDRNYVDAEGKRGAYLDFARVFRKQGKACLRCGTLIEKIRCVGRGTHLCPQCQQRDVRKGK